MRISMFDFAISMSALLPSSSGSAMSTAFKLGSAQRMIDVAAGLSALGFFNCIQRSDGVLKRQFAAGSSTNSPIFSLAPRVL